MLTTVNSKYAGERYRSGPSEFIKTLQKFASYHAHHNWIAHMGITKLICESQLKIKGVFINCSVALVTNYAMKMTTICQPMIEHLCDTNIVTTLHIRVR